MVYQLWTLYGIGSGSYYFQLILEDYTIRVGNGLAVEKDGRSPIWANELPREDLQQLLGQVPRKSNPRRH